MSSPIPDIMLPPDTAHIIQVALTPVFLLSGVGTLLNVFNTRLARVADHAEHIGDLLRAETDPDEARALYRHLIRLRKRRSVLDTAVVLGGLGGAATCGAAFALFVVTARDAAGGWTLFLLFGAALTFTVAALMTFLIDSVLGWHGIRAEDAGPSVAKAAAAKGSF